MDVLWLHSVSHSVTPSRQADCCDYEDDLHSTSIQQRRSSFHGPVRRCDAPETTEIQQHSTRQPQQEPDDGGYGMTTQQKQKQQQQVQQQQEDTGTAGRGRGLLGGPRGGGIVGRGGGTEGVYSSSNRSSQQDLYSRGRANHINPKLGTRDPIVAVPAFLIPNNTSNAANSNETTSSPPIPPPPPPTTTTSTFAVAASTSRPRFPHDYVRQGSTKKSKMADKKK